MYNKFALNKTNNWVVVVQAENNDYPQLLFIRKSFSENVISCPVVYLVIS